MIPSFLAVGLLLPQAANDAPPSTVLVPGGRTRIGLDVKDVERLIQNDPEAAPFAGALIGETPRQDVMVETFWLMTTEVTQEQYAAYVRATGAPPLEPWCGDAIAAAALEFVQAEERRDADAGESRARTSERRTFDPHAWFQANAAHLDWTVPPADRARPAVFVDFTAARAFARWAGMRLPTEHEHQRAVRGDGSAAYPWGNDWHDERYAATSSLRKKGGTWPVGSFPAGRSRQGVLDLCGNVWEWTSSPYAAYPGYQQKIFELGHGKQRRPINAIADWDPEQRVVVGGSFQTGRLMARATTRRGAVRDQSTGALGFRCAASLRPGADMARYLVEDDFDVQLRPRIEGALVEYAPERTLCADAWRTEPSPAAQDGWSPPERYAVIAEHRYVLFVPVAQVPAADIGSFERRSLDEPVPLGLLSANLPLLEPELPAGTYRLAYRARGVRKLGEGRPDAADHFGKAPLEEVLRLDVRVDNVIVLDLRGNPLLALPLHVDYGLEHDGRVESVAEEITRAATGGTDGEAEERGGQDGEAVESSASAIRRVRIDASLPCRTTKKAFLLSLELRVEAGDPRLVWRH